jgi:hypothetical protein
MSSIIKVIPAKDEWATSVDADGNEYRYISHREPRTVVVRCDCGTTVECESFTNTCRCGRDYNWNGDQLAPRSQWGEETGESASEILMGGYDEEGY